MAGTWLAPGSWRQAGKAWEAWEAWEAWACVSTRTTAPAGLEQRARRAHRPRTETERGSGTSHGKDRSAGLRVWSCMSCMLCSAVMKQVDHSHTWLMLDLLREVRPYLDAAAWHSNAHGSQRSNKINGRSWFLASQMETYGTYGNICWRLLKHRHVIQSLRVWGHSDTSSSRGGSDPKEGGVAQKLQE